jgi:hypothetical protein
MVKAKPNALAGKVIATTSLALAFAKTDGLETIASTVGKGWFI